MGIPPLHLFNVGHHLGVDMVQESDGNDRSIRIDQCNGTVFHFAGGISLRVNIGNLLELERSLKSDGISEAAAQVEEIVEPAVLVGNSFDGLVLAQYPINLIRNGSQTVYCLYPHLAR